MKSEIIVFLVMYLTCFGCKKSERNFPVEDGKHSRDSESVISKTIMYKKLNIYELEGRGNKDDAFAAGELGYRYLKGVNVPQNDKIAQKWFLKAALLGDARSQYHLGIIKFDEQNFFDSYVWLVLACSQNENIDSEFGPGMTLRDESRKRLTVEQVVKAQDVAMGLFNSINEKNKKQNDN